MLRLTIYSCRKASAASGPRLGRVLFGCNTGKSCTCHDDGPHPFKGNHRPCLLCHHSAAFLEDHQQSIGRAIVAAAATAAVLVVCNPPAASSSASATDTHTTIATTVTTLPTKKRGQQQHKAYVWGDIRWLQVPSSSSSPSYSSSTNAITTTPLPLPFTNVRALAFGPSFAAALLQDGSVQWKSAQTEKFMPLALPRGERAVKVECTSEKVRCRWVVTSIGYDVEGLSASRPKTPVIFAIL